MYYSISPGYEVSRIYSHRNCVVEQKRRYVVIETRGNVDICFGILTYREIYSYIHFLLSDSSRGWGRF